MNLFRKVVIVAALALAPLAAHTTIAAARWNHATLPALPDSVMTNLGWSHVARTVNPACGEASTRTFFGCTNLETREIEVRASLGPQAAWQALEHEKAHLMFFDGSIEVSGSNLERLCDLVGNTRVQERLAELSR